MLDCKWLPELILYENFDSWKNYEDYIYAIFYNDFIKTWPYFEEKRVRIRYYPKEYGKEEGFYHVTCQDYLKNRDRVPDLRRCERIKWVRSFIEHYNCVPDGCKSCEGMKIWYEPYKSTVRIHILLEEERYIVVIEKRKNYYLLITAFYIDQDRRFKKILERYHIYK